MTDGPNSESHNSKMEKHNLTQASQHRSSFPISEFLDLELWALRQERSTYALT